MAIRGVFASHSALAGERLTDLSARILRTGAFGTAPLLALSAGMPKENATQSSFSWIEDSHITGNQKSTASHNSAVTDIAVDDAGIWTKNTVLMVESTGEYLFVTAVSTDAKTVTVLRGFAGTTAATIADQATIQSIGTAFAEGSGKPDAVTQKGAERTNYVQIFKNGWSITGTAKAVKYLTGSQMAYNREMCLNYHAEDIERAFLFGRKAVTTLAGQQLRLSNGVIAQIEGYGGLVESAAYNGNSGEMSLAGLSNFFRRIFDVQVKGMPNERIAFTGSGTLEQINRMTLMDGNYQISVNESEYGIKVMTLKGFNGDIKFMTHPLMVENPKWTQEIYVLHPGLIRKRVLRDTWTQEFTAGANTNAGVDADEGFIADELGFELRGAKAMGIMRNIQTAVPSF